MKLFLFSKWNKGLKNNYQYKLKSNKPNLTKEESEEKKIEDIREDFINNSTYSRSNYNNAVDVVWKTLKFTQSINKEYGTDKRKYWDDPKTHIREVVLNFARKKYRVR